jgi:hypothetical protein
MTSALALHLKDPRELYQGPLDPDSNDGRALRKRSIAPPQSDRSEVSNALMSSATRFPLDGAAG